jgi:nucleotide-binding universal stress UspA family protein
MAERRIGVAMDFSPSSKKALKWAVDNLVRKGDTLVLLHVRHHGREEAKNALWSHTGSRMQLVLLSICSSGILPYLFDLSFSDLVRCRSKWQL